MAWCRCRGSLDAGGPLSGGGGGGGERGGGGGFWGAGGGGGGLCGGGVVRVGETGPELAFMESR